MSVQPPCMFASKKQELTTGLKQELTTGLKIHTQPSCMKLAASATMRSQQPRGILSSPRNNPRPPKKCTDHVRWLLQ
jgi:hypothetical protein